MNNSVPNRQIAEEAADWAIRIDAGPLGSQERQALADWLRASPAHVDELMYSVSILGGLQGIDRARKLSIDACLAEAASEVVPLFGEREQPLAATTEGVEKGSAMPSPRQLMLAASLALLAVLGFWLVRPPLEGAGDASSNPAVKSYTTDRGEQRSITLADGSVVFLNTSSRLSVRLSSSERRVDLLQGEALFEVARDASRPFRVYAAGTMSQAVGTKFNVRHSASGIQVVVVEGTVLVDSQADDAGQRRRTALNNDAPEPLAPDQALLTAGKQARLSSPTGPPVVGKADIVGAISWRMRQLSFDDAGLGEIVAEFNRYNPTTIVVADPALNDTRFSGVFDANDPNSFIGFLELSTTVEVDRSNPGRIVLEPKRRRKVSEPVAP